MSPCFFTDGKVERGTQTTHHLSVSVEVNVSTHVMPYPTLLENTKYNKTTKFFSDDMALTNDIQIMDFMSSRKTLKTSFPSQPEDNISIGMYSDILSFPPSTDPMPPSPPYGDAPIYPSLHDGSTPIVSPIQVDNAVSPDLFEGASVGEDISRQKRQKKHQMERRRNKRRQSRMNSSRSRKTKGNRGRKK